MTIVEVIEEVVKALSQNPAFYHSEKWESNLEDTSTIFPVVILDHPILSKDRILSYGNIETTYSLSILFAKKGKMDDFQADRQPTLNLCYDMKREFLIRLGNHSLWSSFAVRNVIEVFRLKDIVLDGIYLQLDVSLVDTNPVCLIEWKTDLNGAYIYDQNGNKIPKVKNETFLDGFWLSVTNDAYLIFDETINGIPTGNLLYSKKQEFTMDITNTIISKIGGHFLHPNATVDPTATGLITDEYGLISNVTPNGTFIIGQMEVACFPYPNALTDIGNGFYKESIGSGLPNIGPPYTFPMFRQNKIVFALN